MLNLLGMLREAEASAESWTVVEGASVSPADLLGFHMFSRTWPSTPPGFPCQQLGSCVFSEETRLVGPNVTRADCWDRLAGLEKESGDKEFSEIQSAAQ